MAHDPKIAPSQSRTRAKSCGSPDAILATPANQAQPKKIIFESSKSTVPIYTLPLKSQVLVLQLRRHSRLHIGFPQALFHQR